MIKKLKYITPVILLMLTISCGGSSENNDDDGPEPIAPTPPPEAAILVFPENNTECNISEVLSNTQSTVPFLWNPSQNTDTYQISIRNLNTNTIVISQVVTNPEADITLERGTPYEWSIESRANGTNETASSSSFRFFNEGPGIQNYAPFPAKAINPARGVSIISKDNQNNTSQSEIFSFRVL
jgi:hypothetical protein